MTTGRLLPRAARLLAVSAVAVLVGGLTGCGSGSDDGLPDRRLDSLDGRSTLELASLEGTPTVMNFWATWCAPCRAELPAFQAVHQELGDEVRFLGVNVERGGDAAQDYLDELGIDFEQYVDPDGSLLTELDVIGLPVTLVVDAEGTVVEHHIGALDEDSLRDLLSDVRT